MIQRRCKHPTCRTLIDYSQTHCDKHKTTREKQYNHNRRRYDPEYMSFYQSNAWRKIREQVLIRDNYVCNDCGRIGNVVDHIVPTKQDWDKRLDYDNLQVLCHSCHNIKTARE